MARLRYNGLTATLGADLLTAGTTITFTAALTHAAGVVPTITGTDYIPLSILAADGTVLEILHLTAYTTGATTGTVARAQESTTAADRAAGLSVVHGLTVADATAFTSGGSSGVIASTSYNPGTQASYTTSSTTLVDIDATNLAVTFTAPSSGAVIVGMSGLATQTGGQTLFWGLRSGATDVASRWMLDRGATDAFNIGLSLDLKVSGLTPGNSYTYKWAHRVASGSASLHTGGPVGPALMRVTAA